MVVCSACQESFTSYQHLQTHMLYSCNAQHGNNQDRYPPSDQLAIDKVNELKMLKKTRQMRREERTSNELQLLNRVKSLHHPLLATDDHLYKKTRELQVRGLINNERHQDAFDGIQTSNLKLESLKKELSERIHAVEDARIRLSLGVPPRQNTELASSSDAPQVAGLIERVEDTFSAIQHRIEHVARRNHIILDNCTQPNPPTLATGTTDLPKTQNGSAKQQRVEHLEADIVGVRQDVQHEQRPMPDFTEGGGQDHSLLARLSALEARAAAQPKDPAQGDAIPRDGDLLTITAQLASVQMENARLANELRDLKAVGQNKGHIDPPVNIETRGSLSKQRAYSQQWVELRDELDHLRQQVALQQQGHMTGRGKPTTPPSAQRNEVERRPFDHTSSRRIPVPSPGLDTLPPAPYDPKGGFVVFYDFVVGVDQTAEACGLVASLYTHHAAYGEPGEIPTVLCTPMPQLDGTEQYNMAVVATKQQVPRCQPAWDLSLIVELQVSVSENTVPRSPAVQAAEFPLQLTAMAWCRMPLFDATLRLCSGWWRIPLRVLPVRPELSGAGVNAVPQYEQAELLVRVANLRDADHQTNVPLDLGRLRSMYQYHDMAFDPMTPDLATPSTLPTIPAYFKSGQSLRGQSPIDRLTLRSDRPYEGYKAENVDIGIQVINVKNAPLGEARVRISIYDMQTGKVAEAAEGPASCVTSPVRSGFRHSLHVFGLQESVFHQVVLTSHHVMVIKLSMRLMQKKTGSHQNVHLEEERTIAWATLPLLRQASDRSLSGPSWRLCKGRHQLQLLQPPMPDMASTQKLLSVSSGQPLGRASVTVCVFTPDHRPYTPAPSPPSSDDEADMSQSWIPVDEDKSHRVPFVPGDGFDIYIDGARFLPDRVTISKVAGRVLDCDYHRVGRDLSAVMDLDSDIYNPVYRYRLEVREDRVPPTATLLLKVYTIDQWTSQLAVAGYAMLKVLTVLGAAHQPVNNSVTDVALNEGAHQVALYARGPDGLDPIRETCLQSVGVRRVPCASLLVRLVKAPRDANRKPLQAIKVPQSDWVRLGLWVDPPAYSQGYYRSLSCKPTEGERWLYQTQRRRLAIAARDALMIEKDKQGALTSDKAIESFMKNQLNRPLDTTPDDLDLTYVAQYSPKYGVKVSVDRADRLPWHGFTQVTVCVSPPAALYQGSSQTKFDPPMYTTMMDLHTTAQAPRWTDGYKWFTHRTYHPHLCAIIHLHEVVVTVDTKDMHYAITDEAWAVVPLVTSSYAVTSVLQVPLFSGRPSTSQLAQLATTDFSAWQEKNLKAKKDKLKLVRGASVWVRVADGRRGDELQDVSLIKDQASIDRHLLPDPAQYPVRPPQGAPAAAASSATPLRRLVPANMPTATFSNRLTANFKLMVGHRYSKEETSTYRKAEHEKS